MPIAYNTSTIDARNWFYNGSSWGLRPNRLQLLVTERYIDDRRMLWQPDFWNAPAQDTQAPNSADGSIFWRDVNKL